MCRTSSASTPKHANPAPLDCTTVVPFVHWKLHNLVTLERLDSPFTLTFYIAARLSPKVALLASPHAHYAAKFYHTDETSTWHVDRELEAYARAPPLQGRCLPHFYGTWRVSGAVCVVLLMEAVLPGICMSSMEEEERRKWHKSATTAVEEMNKAGVVHRDLGGEHVLLGAGGKVVFVGFGWSIVKGTPGWGIPESLGQFHTVFGGTEAERLTQVYLEGVPWRKSVGLC